MFARACAPTFHSSHTPKKIWPYFFVVVVQIQAHHSKYSALHPLFCFSLMLYSFYSEQASLFLSSEEVQGIMSKASGLIKQPGAIPPPPPSFLLPWTRLDLIQTKAVLKVSPQPTVSPFCWHPKNGFTIEMIRNTLAKTRSPFKDITVTFSNVCSDSRLFPNPVQHLQTFLLPGILVKRDASEHGN